jgi:phosphoglycerate dehydrogenase-like enzyme
MKRSSAPFILISTNRIFPAGKNYFDLTREIAPEARVVMVAQEDVSSDLLASAEVFFGWPNVDELRQAESLMWLHLPSAGADRFARRDLFYNPDCQLTCSRGVFGIPIAEHVLCMILSFARAMPYYAEQQRQKVWQRLFGEREFSGCTVGIIGMGNIGAEVARRAQALGAKVLGAKRRPEIGSPHVDELYGEKGIDALLAQSDYVVIALPYTARTKGIISRERIGKMKPGACLINVARGGLVDQQALIEALQQERIGGAGLDATDPEPLPEDSPLWQMPNVILTPHTAGSSPSKDVRRFQIFHENLRLYLEGQPLKNRVSFDEGY